MSDSETTIAQLRETVKDFVSERNWAQFHNPKDLSVSLCIEAAELLEEFQWLSPEEVEGAMRDPDTRSRVAGELADVLIYGLSLANAVDLDIANAVTDKLAVSGRKYPADRYWGRFR